MATMVTPKSDELIADPNRQGGQAEAAEWFEAGFSQVFSAALNTCSDIAPITVYYAFKQSETDESGTASTGWETLLQAMIGTGWAVTSTWPLRTEMASRMRGLESNALASSIVLSCRPRSELAEAVTRRSFLSQLKAEFPGALRRLQQGSIAPVDLAQAAIGPGIGVFSRYARVVEADGSEMTVRTALALINQALDEVLTEQEGDFDADTRFCVKWFSQFGWNEGTAGEADVLARATNTSIDGLVRGGVFRAVAGKASLRSPEELGGDWDPEKDERISDWEVVLRLAKALERRGAVSATRLMSSAGQRVDLDTAKELAYLLFSLSEKRGWAQSALLFNSLGTSWSELAAAARRGAGSAQQSQGAFEFEDEE
jgi:putative DNA methylase